MMKDTLRITLVDDDSIFCFLFRKFLEKYHNKNTELSIFPDGYTAAEFFRKNKANKETYPQVLFIDINMPLMNGWELMTSIDRKSTRLNSSHVKISYAVFCLKKKNKKTKQ